MKYVALAALTACSFDHGEPPTMMQPDDGSVGGDTRMIDAAIDAAADARACPGAPPNCSVFTCPSSSSCYYLCGTTGTTDQSWTGAKGSCEMSQRGCLVTISDQAEQDCITQHAMPSFPNAITWVGYRQATNATQANQGWAWICGSSGYLSPQWGMFEPNDNDQVEDHDEDCLELIGGGGWNDADCTGTGRFVCELL